MGVRVLFRALQRNRAKTWDSPDGPGVKNLPCNAEDIGSVPGQRTKNPHAVERLSLHATTRESMHHLENPTSHNSDPMQPNKQKNKVKKKSELFILNVVSGS